ncbi:hypothetical protein A2U01_0062635, partial [Trifolium medium]|nr:hypothetical protein [Trifolium medium]
MPQLCGTFILSAGVKRLNNVHDVLFVALHVLLLMVVVGSGVFTFNLLATLTLSFNVVVIGHNVE